MNRIEKIKILIGELDDYEDALIIAALNHKIHCINEEYKEKHSISDKELKSAINGNKRTLLRLSNELYETIPRFIKARNLNYKYSHMNSNVCENCKHSITEKNEYYEFEYVSFNIKSEVCKRCLERRHTLLMPYEKYLNNEEKNIRHIQSNYEDIWRCKAMIIKINNKIKTLKNETSKQ